MINEQFSGITLFVCFFILYGLEYFFPLTLGTRRHFWTNVGFALLLFALNVASASFTLQMGKWIEIYQLGLFSAIAIPVWLQVILAIVFMDFWAGYSPHVLSHRIVFLWHFHSIHHSDDHVDVTTTFRKHPIESVLGIAFNLTGMVILGIQPWILLIYLTLATIHAQLEHANISLPAKVDRILQYLIVTPNMHKIHHSIHEHESDSNFSNIFSFWDRLFQTYRKMETYSGIQYGLDYVPKQSISSFWRMIKWPIMSARLFRAAKRVVQNHEQDRQKRLVN